MIVVFLLFFSILVLYKYLTRHFNYWKKRSIPQVRTSLPFFGSFLEIFTFRVSPTEIFKKFYLNNRHPYVGAFLCDKPCLIIRDVKLIKLILTKDFKYFGDRIGGPDKSWDSLGSQVLTFLKLHDWKIVRDRLSGAFSVNKVKKMVLLINKVALDLEAYLEANWEKIVDVKEICSKYTTDTIVSCAFGIQANSFKNEDAKFRAIGRSIFDTTGTASGRLFLNFFFPDLARCFRIGLLEDEASTFFSNVFWEMIKQREKISTKNDLFDYIIRLKDICNKENVLFGNDTVIAQAIQIFAAGMETTASTTSFALYELSLHQSIQEKVRIEIRDTMNKFGELNYEAVKSMEYLDMIVCETLRKYPGIPVLDRMCIENYKIPDQDVVIEKGTPIFVPVVGLHYDSDIYPNPEKFIPERFTKKGNEYLKSYVYMPFGNGPKRCLGEELGLLAVKIALSSILSKFLVTIKEGSSSRIRFHPNRFVTGIVGTFPISFKKRIN